MTSAEHAEMRVVLRWLKILAVGVVVAAFALGGWVVRLQGEVGKIPVLETQVRQAQRAMEDLVLLQCADTSLNVTAQRICAKYEPRMPR